jgi:hypothetical protein
MSSKLLGDALPRIVSSRRDPGHAEQGLELTAANIRSCLAPLPAAAQAGPADSS